MKTLSKLLILLLTLAMIFSFIACKQTEKQNESTGSVVSITSGDEAVSDTGSLGEVSQMESVDMITSGSDNTNTGSKSNTASKGNNGTTSDVSSGMTYGSRPKGDANVNIPKVIDMKGATITLGTKWITDWGNGKSGESADGDKWIAWRKNFEKTYNCKLKNVQIPAYTLFQSVATKLMSGDKVADIMTMQLFDIEGFRHAGLLQPLQKSTALNLEHGMVVQDLVDCFTFNGNSYAYFAGDFIPEVNGMFVNLDMVRELKLDDPIELVKQKKWTWAAFDKMCKAAYKDLNKNNKIDAADRYGASIGGYQVSGSLRVSNAAIISYKNGRFSYTFNNATTLKYLNEIKATFNAGDRLLPSDQYEQRQKKFVKGELLFCGDPCNTASEKDHIFYSADFEYGYLPCPTMEAGMEYSNSCSTWLCGYTIPVGTTQLTNIGYVLNAVADMNSTMTAENLKEYQRMIGGVKQNLDILYPIFRRFTKDVYCWQDQFKVCMEQNLNIMLNDNKITPAYYLESIDSTMKNAVKDYYAKDPDCIS